MFKLGDKVTVDYSILKRKSIKKDIDGDIFEITYKFNFMDAYNIMSIKTGNVSTVETQCLSHFNFKAIFNKLCDANV